MFNSINKQFKITPMRKLLITSLFVLTPLFLISQERKADTLKTEEIEVVKPYTPTISTSFKVKSDPIIGTDTIHKENVKYSIFSIPVASTFTPSKGKAQQIKKAPKERLYENYISAGFGNFTSPLFEAYIHTGDKRYSDFGVFVNHHSSEGGIKDLLLKDNFADTRFDLYYKQFDRDYNWQINGGVQRQLVNYYGIDQNLRFEEAFLGAMDEKQLYKNLYVGGQINFKDSFFKGASAEIINFTDYYNSNEFRAVIKPSLEFPISTELIRADFKLDILTSNFDQEYILQEEQKYSYLNLSLNPNFEVLRENLRVNLGARLYYTNNLEEKTSDFLAYPNVDASLKLIDDIFILVAGVNGDLVQHSYRDFSLENPFISPTLNILQTDKQYRAYIGAKGKLASNIGYNFNISHTNEVNRNFFVQNQIQSDGDLAIDHAFQAGNSFGVIYDDLKTLGFFGELTIDASKEFNFSGTVHYASYTPSSLEEVWNMPKIKATINASFLNNSWFAGAKLFYNGPTFDYIIPFDQLTTEGVIVENESYMDLNINGGYIFSDRLSAFAKINNALGKKYHRYYNYEVQPLQILAGITYKFDL